LKNEDARRASEPEFQADGLRYIVVVEVAKAQGALLPRARISRNQVSALEDTCPLFLVRPLAPAL
jgi:hypothetical protein